MMTFTDISVLHGMKVYAVSLAACLALSPSAHAEEARCQPNRGAVPEKVSHSQVSDAAMERLDLEHQADALGILGDEDFLSLRSPELLDVDWASELGHAKFRHSYLINLCVYGAPDRGDDAAFERWANSRYVKATFDEVGRTLATSHFSLGRDPELTSRLVFVVHLPVPLKTVVSEAAIAGE